MRSSSTAVRRTALLAAVIAMTAVLAAWRHTALAVASVSLSPASVATGASSLGTVTLDQAARGTTRVDLSSSSTAVATVPASVTLGGTARTSTSNTFSVRSVAGAAGCTFITARLGSTPPRSTLLTVMPPPTSSGAPVRVTAPATGVGGTTITGTLTVFGAPNGTAVVKLASSDPTNARVPISVNVQVNTTEIGNMGSATFPIQTSPVGLTTCPVITATLGTNTSKALIRLVSISG
jgi:trimeric autotransporter adhesin